MATPVKKWTELARSLINKRKEAEPSAGGTLTLTRSGSDGTPWSRTNTVCLLMKHGTHSTRSGENLNADIFPNNLSCKSVEGPRGIKRDKVFLRDFRVRPTRYGRRESVDHRQNDDVRTCIGDCSAIFLVQETITVSRR